VRCWYDVAHRPCTRRRLVHDALLAQLRAAAAGGDAHAWPCRGAELRGRVLDGHPRAGREAQRGAVRRGDDAALRSAAAAVARARARRVVARRGVAWRRCAGAQGQVVDNGPLALVALHNTTTCQRSALHCIEVTAQVRFTQHQRCCCFQLVGSCVLHALACRHGTAVGDVAGEHERTHRLSRWAAECTLKRRTLPDLDVRTLLVGLGTNWYMLSRNWWYGPPATACIGTQLGRTPRAVYGGARAPGSWGVRAGSGVMSRARGLRCVDGSGAVAEADRAAARALLVATASPSCAEAPADTTAYGEHR
jgi:hypothetical protein